MSSFTVEGGAPLRGRVEVPGDKSISHRALLLASLAEEPSRLRNLSPGDDVAASRRLIEALGAQVSGRGEDLEVRPGQRHSGQALAVDCGNSGTTMRLGAGVLTHTARTTMLFGDASLSSRPMSRVLDPLAAMGAGVWSAGGRAPVVVQGGELRGIDLTPAVASAQVKGAVLLAGLGAAGETTVREPVPTRAHTEELLRLGGADVTVGPGWARVRPSSLSGLSLQIPGDPSAAAFWIVAASILPGSLVTVESIYSGTARCGFLDILRRMGADMEVTDRGPGLIDVRVAGATLSATEITEAAEVAGAVDELPVLAVAASCATGTTVIEGAQELRAKESDRLMGIRKGLQAFGVEVEETDDGLVIRGRGPGGLVGTTVDSQGDHRIAMAMAVAGLVASGRTRVEGWECVTISDPRFGSQLERLVDR